MAFEASLLAAVQPRRNQATYNAQFIDIVEHVCQPGGYSDQLAEVVADYVPWATSTKNRRAEVVARFTSIHQSEKWKSYAGREFEIGEIMERAKDFLTAVLHTSQSIDDRSKRMRWSSFNLVQNDLHSVIVAYCVEARGKTELHKQWNRVLRQHARFIAERAAIPRDRKPKYYFGSAEVLLMAETALTCSQSCMDNILQHILVWTTMFYTAARPGSVIATDNYLDAYLRYEDIVISRTEIPLAFNVEVTIVSFKGGHGLQTWAQAFRFSPVQFESHLLIDAGLLLVIMGLRRGAFRDYSDLDSLIAGRELNLRWKEDLLKQPVFCAGVARGLNINPTRPMRYQAFRDFLKTTCVNAGLGDEHASSYCFRRGTATTMTRVLGSELAKAILQHKQNSETLQRSYAYNAGQQDLTSAILYDTQAEAVGRSKYDAPALHRPVFPNNAAPRPRLLWEEALAISDDLRLLHMQRMLLSEVMEKGGGVDDAKEVFDTLLDADKKAYEALLQDPESREGIVLAMHGRISAHSRAMFSKMQARFRRVQARRAHAEAELPTLEEIGARLARLDTNSPLLAVLHRLRATDAPDGTFTISCPTLESPDGLDIEEGMDAARDAFARALVGHAAVWRGAQGCPICQNDSSFPEDTRNRVYRSKSKLERHIQEFHRYLVSKPRLGEPLYDAMAPACWGDPVF